MFANKKKLKEIEEMKQELLFLKQELKREKQELLFIKEQLEDSTPKIDISNVYVWEDKGVYSIVKLDIQKIRGINLFHLGQEVDGYESTLIDIFSNNVIYQKDSMSKIKREEYITGERLGKGHTAYLIPICEVDKNLLAYTDKKVPLYVLQQLYYKLNNVDVNAYTLKKEK